MGVVLFDQSLSTLSSHTKQCLLALLLTYNNDFSFNTCSSLSVVSMICHQSECFLVSKPLFVWA